MGESVNFNRRRLFKGKLPTSKTLPRLPYSVEETQFLSDCTQCGKCIDICETRLLTKDDLGFPFADFDKSECTDCGKCHQVCPENLKQESATKPWAGDFLIKSDCLAKHNIYCKSCQDVCESKAISFQFIDSNIPTPSLDLDNCTQCGACVSICPQSAIEYASLNLQKEKEAL